MSMEKSVDNCTSSQQLQHFTLSEARALRSIYTYFRSDDDEVDTSVICLAVINDLGRDHSERSCMKRALDESLRGDSNEIASFLSILDHGRKLLAETYKGEGKGDDLMSGKYWFLLLLHEYQRRCNDEGKYLLAAEFMEHEKRLQKEEETRQIELVKRKHNRDRNKIVAAHAKQMDEFKESWEQFMVDFEQKSQDQINVLTFAHQEQQSSLKQSISESINTKPKNWSRDLIEYRERQVLLANQQRYQEAHKSKQVSDALEQKEKANMNSRLDSSLMMRERSLIKQQQAEMDVLKKRIDSKRRDYMKQRDGDCAKLAQRNKNIQTTIDTRHASERASLASKIEQSVKALIKESGTM